MRRPTCRDARFRAERKMRDEQKKEMEKNTPVKRRVVGEFLDSSAHYTTLLSTWAIKNGARAKNVSRESEREKAFYVGAFSGRASLVVVS